MGWGFNMESPAAKEICDHLGLDFSALCDGRAELNQVHANAVFSFQYGTVLTEAKSLFPNFDTMPEEAQAVITDLLFNLGMTVFLKFKKTIAALKIHDWKTAADELTDSLWFHQTGRRAKDDIALLRII